MWKKFINDLKFKLLWAKVARLNEGDSNFTRRLGEVGEKLHNSLWSTKYDYDRTHSDNNEADRFIEMKKPGEVK